MSEMLPSLYPEPISMREYYLLEIIAFLGDEAHIPNLLAEIGKDEANDSHFLGLALRLTRLREAGLVTARRQRPDFSSKHPFNPAIFALAANGKAMLDAMRAYRDVHVAYLRLPPPADV